MVITKTDICPPNVLNRTVNEISRIITKNFKKELVLLDENLNNRFNPDDQGTVNYFKISNVSGQGLDYFRNHLYNLNTLTDWASRKDKDSVVWIDNVYQVVGIGMVLSGTVKHGEVRIGDRVLLRHI